jgi:hypothetical protein
MRKFNWTVFILLLSVFGTIFAQASPSIVAENVATKSPLYYNHTPNITRSSDGTLVAVWKSGDKQIVCSTYDNAFSSWYPPVVLSSAGDVAEKAGIASDDNGNIYVVWQQRETSGQDYAIYFTKKNGNTWDTPKNLTGNDVENEEVGIAVSDQGVIFVAWNTDAEKDSSEFVLCIRSDDNGTTWSVADTLSSSDGIIGGKSTTSGRPYLAKATNGKMVCAWHEEPLGHSDRESFTNQYDGSKWLGEITYINVNDSANTMYPAVAVDSDDNIYMVNVSYTKPARLLFLKKAWGDAAWTDGSKKMLIEDTQLTKPVMGIDNNNNIYLGYRRDNVADTTKGIEEVVFITSGDQGDTWSEPTLLSRENYDAGYLTLAPNIRESGVDFLWRESSTQFVDDEATTVIVYGHTNLLTDIDDNKTEIVNSYELQQNYPNPFNPSTTISYSLREKGLVTLKIFDILGREVTELVNEVKNAGNYKIAFNASNLTSGLYIYQIQAGNFSAIKKMILLK